MLHNVAVKEYEGERNFCTTGSTTVEFGDNEQIKELEVWFNQEGEWGLLENGAVITGIVKTGNHPSLLSATGPLSMVILSRPRSGETVRLVYSEVFSFEEPFYRSICRCLIFFSRAFFIAIFRFFATWAQPKALGNLGLLV